MTAPALVAEDLPGARPDGRLSVAARGATMAGMDVALREITPANLDEVRALRVAENQTHLVDGVELSLAEAAENPSAHPWYRAIYAGDRPVGFLMLADDVPPGHPVLPFRYYLWRLLIDERHQGRGYGRAALDLLVAYVRTRPGAEVLATSVNLDDGSPLGFYLAYGFTDAGRKFDHEHLLELDLRA